jgi:hypothetical protein
MFPPDVRLAKVMVAVVLLVKLTVTVAYGPVNPLIAELPAVRSNTIVSACAAEIPADRPNTKLTAATLPKTIVLFRIALPLGSPRKRQPATLQLSNITKT